MNYPVVEIFESIQGEGVHMGALVTFIRLGGCNLDCAWCDTEFDRSELLTVPEIVEKIGTRIVVITGGEPSIHRLDELLDALKQQDRYIAIETNGTYPITEVYGDKIDWIACSPKPQSKYEIAPGCIPDELKYVVDKEFHADMIDETYANIVPIWLQPQGFEMHESAKRAYQIVVENPEMNLRLGIQLHKIFNLQ